MVVVRGRGGLFWFPRLLVLTICVEKAFFWEPLTWPS